MYSRYKKIAVMVLAWLVIAFVPVHAQLLPPEKYPEGTCELAAKEYRAIYGGNLIFIQPLKNNGAFDLGEYNGAWLNRAWSKERGTYYIYYPSTNYFNNTDEIKQWYSINTGKQSEVYNINEVHPPFNLVYHY